MFVKAIGGMSRTSRAIQVVIALLITTVVVVGVLRGFQSSSDEGVDDEGVDGAEASSPPLYDVTIRKPAGPPRVDLGVTGPEGQVLTAACSSCHGSRSPDKTNRQASDLTEFHQGLKLAHGSVTCLSCHNSNDYDTLALADGAAVDYSDVMTLCSQCHGPQTRDYNHGSHGGMSGYWDRTRGPRTRNNCVDCHNPHAPAFPLMKPKFKPIDRFLEKDHG